MHLLKKGESNPISFHSFNHTLDLIRKRKDGSIDL